ncbi:hypothetical protein FGO68_gene15476 [Halteria grandinella]|uniref:Arylamine N-acetyltransferase n=1 Tax=Halteria grandinella TaxID=5974 RepID=A0A8J8SZQ1_HALGN|nr:hypothetical protein FGO68_gene15476 [Halteria grandinella]
MEVTKPFKIPFDQLSEIYSKMGLPLNFQFTPTKESLYLLANKFYTAFAYTALDLHTKSRRPFPIDLSSLIERMCTKNLGGMCYEHDLLIYYILKHVGFEVSFVEVDDITMQKRWINDVVSAHAFVYVELNGKCYIVDPGYGLCGYRYPIEFDPNKELNEVSLSKEEKYIIEAGDDFYSMTSNYPSGDFSLFYTFQRPLIKRDVSYIEMAYARLFTTDTFIPIRDSRFYSSTKLDDGVIYLMFIRDADEFVAFKKELKRGKPVEKQVYKTFEEFREETIRLTGVQVPSRDEIIAKVYE